MTPKVSDFWISCCKGILDGIYPPKCSLCESFSTLNPCVQCRGEMVPNDPQALFYTDQVLDFQASVYRYEGRAGQAVRRLKYERRTGLAKFLGQEMVELANREGLLGDLVVPVPIHWTRMVSRGFNQSDLLSKEFPKGDLVLRRSRATQSQAGLTHDQRLKNLSGAFQVIGKVAGKSILLVDDVVTSGQTARECSQVLKQAGAKEVGILAFCGEV